MDLAAEMQTVPEAENPFTHHPSPLQAGCKLQATGRGRDAALAFEAAGMVSPAGCCSPQQVQYSVAAKPGQPCLPGAAAVSWACHTALGWPGNRFATAVYS